MTNAPGDVIEYTLIRGHHVQMLYGSSYDWDDALYWALLEITGDSDD